MVVVTVTRVGGDGSVLARTVHTASRPDPGRWELWVRGAIGGAWRMVWLGLVLSFAGLAAIAAARPDDTRAFFSSLFS